MRRDQEKWATRLSGITPPTGRPGRRTLSSPSELPSSRGVDYVHLTTAAPCAKRHVHTHRPISERLVQSLSTTELAEVLLRGIRDEAIYALDVEGRIVGWYAGAQAVFGYEVPEVIGRHVALLYPPEQARCGAPDLDLRRAEAEGHTEAAGWRLHADGRRLWMESATSAVRATDGRLRGFACVARDTTERLRTEEALRLSEAKFSGIVAIAADAIVTVDAEQRIVLFNRGAEQIFGYAAHEAIGASLDVLLPERFRRAHRGHVAGFGHDGVRARRMGERGEIYGLRKDGSEFPAEASISRIEVGGQPLFTAVLRDVSARRAAEQRIAELLTREQTARADAEAAVCARDEVFRIVSHDLGNSLSAVLVNATVLLRTLPDAASANLRARAASIRELAEQMQHLRRDLLDVANLEAGQLSIEPEVHDPGEFAAQAYEHFAALAAERGVSPRFQRDDELPRVRADRDRIMQVLGNLLGNAVKFTPAGGRVLLSVEAAEGIVRFTVADTGVGIDPAHLPHIFDRFWHARTANRGGAGLGLAIARGIVDAHGGTLRVTSQPGEGSSFTFELPAVAD